MSDRDDLERRLASTTEELDSTSARLESLRRELDLLRQDNLSLEEGAKEQRERLQKEKEELDGHASFLHFTQEQLKTEVGNIVRTACMACR